MGKPSRRTVRLVVCGGQGVVNTQCSKRDGGISQNTTGGGERNRIHPRKTQRFCRRRLSDGGAVARRGDDLRDGINIIHHRYNTSILHTCV